MVPSNTRSTNQNLAASLNTVQFEAESESFRATYDNTRDSTSLAVVEVVATALGRDPTQLTPLHSVIDTDSLEELATESPNGHGNCDSISFCYEDFEITVLSDGSIEADPIENT